MIIGLTGSIGSGKTTAAGLFMKHGFEVVDADRISHALMAREPTRSRVIGSFGKGILGRNGEIERQKLGDIVFSDPHSLRKLNSIMHPRILEEMKKEILDAKKRLGNGVGIIVEAPLLLETGAVKLVDKVIVIKAGINTIKKRNGRIAAGRLERILKFQMPLREKLRHADFVLDNSRDLDHLENQVKKIIASLTT